MIKVVLAIMTVSFRLLEFGVAAVPPRCVARLCLAGTVEIKNWAVPSVRPPAQRAEQLSFKLGSWNEPGRLPGGLVSEHCIKSNQQLAHASCQSHLLLFARMKQATIEGFDNKVVFGRH